MDRSEDLVPQTDSTPSMDAPSPNAWRWLWLLVPIAIAIGLALWIVV